MISEHTNITCPDCRGAFERNHDGNLVQYQCRVGHSYSAQSALAAHALTEGNTLWAAVAALEEGADLLEQVSRFIGSESGDGFINDARVRRPLAQRIREVLKELRPPHLP